MGTYTTNGYFYKPTQGETPYDALVNAAFDLADAAIYSASINNLTATVPLVRSLNNLALSYNATNLKVTSNALNTSQNISTGSTPTFANLTVDGNLVVGYDPYYSIILITGSIYERGNIHLYGNIDISGSTNITGSTFVSESLVSRNLIVNPKAEGVSLSSLPSGFEALISGSMKISGSLVATNQISSSEGGIYGNNLLIAGQGVIYGPVQISDADTGYTEQLHVDGNAFITTNLNFGSSSAHTHNVTGSFNVTPSASLMNYPLSRHLGSNAGAPLITPLREGDTYWDTSSSRGYMLFGGSWRQIT